MIKVVVKKNEVESCRENNISADMKILIDYFQEHMGDDNQKAEFLPYIHQYRTFEKIMKDEEVLLTAGTSAGKTISHSIPLFYKVKEGIIDKILLLYPTRALLQDQLREMSKLAEAYGLENEIAEIKGGMSRTQVITALNKKIIIATPDSIYWFFNKNIKYSSFLIYGLAQIDEVVIDEAHLFTGLVLNNLIFLIERMKKLAKKVDKEQRYHILTATANDSLQKIYQQAIDEIPGKSNCGNIDLEIRSKAGKFSGELFEEALIENVIASQEELSCVAILNSAKVAHQLFYSNTQEIKPEDLAKELQKEFIYNHKEITIKELLSNIEDVASKDEIEKKLIESSSRLLSNIYLRDYIAEVGTLELKSDNEKVFAVISNYLEEGYRRFEKVIDKSSKSEDFIEELEEQIARDKYVRELYNVLRLNDEISIDTDKEEFEILVEKRFTEFKSFLANGQKIIVNYKNDKDRLDIKAINYNGNNYKSYKLLHQLKNNLTLLDIEEEFAVDEEDLIKEIESIKLEVGILKEILGQDFKNSWLKEIRIPRYIAKWKDNEDVIVILYTGSMSNYVRDGLMEFFDRADYKRKILLSTSAVEVGVDFDCDLLITEETNLASFLQRFGRAGRSGKDSKVKVFVTEESYLDIESILINNDEISREDFSERIEEIFAEIKGIEESEFLEAYHYIINQNLGRIAKQLNENQDLYIKDLAEKLRGRIDLNYGLRGTMPGVSLKGGVTKNPFYILRFLENSDLLDSDSPFEIARSDKSFDSIIWQSYDESEDVYVDIDFTLDYSKLMFIAEEDELKPYLREGICGRYESKFLRSKDNFEKQREELFVSDKYQQLADYDQAMLKYLLTENYELMFGFGDIFLRKDSGPVFIEDKRLTIPNQFFLYLTGDENRQQEYLDWLKKNKIFDYGEVIIDDTDYEERLNEEHQARVPGGIILLENINGALFTIYRRLIAAQKAGEL